MAGIVRSRYPFSLRPDGAKQALEAFSVDSGPRGADRRGTAPDQPQLTGIFNPQQYPVIFDQFIALPANQSVRILTQNSSFRNWLMFRNPDLVANVFLSFGQDATALSTMLLVPSTATQTSMILLDTGVPQNDVYAFASAACNFCFAYSTFNSPQP